MDTKPITEYTDLELLAIYRQQTQLLAQAQNAAAVLDAVDKELNRRAADAQQKGAADGDSAGRPVQRKSNTRKR